MVKTDRIVALATIAISIFLYTKTGSFVQADSGTPISATFFPRCILISLILCCILLVIKSSMKPVDFPAPFGVVSAAVQIVVYILLISPVGYFIVTPLFLFLLPASLGYRSWGWLTGMALGGTAFSYVVFQKVLGVPLPMGLLENIGGM